MNEEQRTQLNRAMLDLALKEIEEYRNKKQLELLGKLKEVCINKNDNGMAYCLGKIIQDWDKDEEFNSYRFKTTLFNWCVKNVLDEVDDDPCKIREFIGKNNLIEDIII